MIRIFPISLILTGLVMAAAPVSAQDAEEVMRRIDEKQRTETSQSRMVMEIHPVAGSDRNMREYRIESFSREPDDTYMEFVDPRSIRGLRVLERGEGIRVYFPSTGRIRRITGEQQGGSVGGVGGDFSYEDMGSGTYTDDYRLSLENETQSRWVIRGVPTDPESTYTHVRFHVDTDRLRVVKTEFFTEEEGHLKTLHHEEYRLVGDVEIATRLRMINHDEERSTVVRIAAFRTDIEIDPKYFNPNRFYR